jgi:hypothetical protein
MATGLVPVLLLARCNTGACDSASSASDGCGPPVYGYAGVQGDAADAAGAPIPGKDAWVACGDVVGAYSDQTDTQGRFQVGLVYAVFDTMLYPFPPRDPDGSFQVDCSVSLRVSAELLLLREHVPVRFAPRAWRWSRPWWCSGRQRHS